jgi:ABC-type glycerol-3-phosphate transport system substrate-binding protein
MMKRLHFVFLMLGALFVFAACGANGKSAVKLDGDFFNRKIEGEITVSAYESASYRNYLETAARAFEERYPGTKVNVETFSSMPEVRSSDQGNMRVTAMQVQDDPGSRSDYLSRINTNIMSGTGADIYAMDIIPLHKFVESGTLENLEPYMENDPEFNRNDYRQNILDALRYRGGTWFLPLDYSFKYYAYDSTLVPAQIASGFGVDKAWSAQELLALGIPLYDGSYKLFNALDFVMGPGGMFYQLLTENMASFVNLETGRPNFTDGGFASLLALVSDYGRQGYFPKGITGAQDAEQLMLQVMNAPTDRFFFKLNGPIYLISQFGRNVGLRFMMATGGTARSIESDDEIVGIQANADGSVPFEYNMAFAVNSQSKNRETAWAFMKFLLSKEIQLSTNPYFLSLNNEAREEKAGLVFSLNNPSRTLNEQQRQALEAYKAAVEALSDNINCYMVQDTNINDMILQEARYFFEGSRNADEVTRVLQNKADLYLSE